MQNAHSIIRPVFRTLFPILTTLQRIYPLRRRAVYCHTLENKSSSPPKPEALPAGLLPVAGPALLDQPPNSSSAATLGAGLKPPPIPGTIGVLANAPVAPHPALLEAGLGISGLFCAGGGAAAAAGGPELHSLLPHTSDPDHPPKEPAPALGAGDGAAGLACEEERLKTEPDAAAGAGWNGGGEVVV